MSNFKTAESFIADLKSSDYFKDNPHLIKDLSVYRWLKLALKKFGRNVMTKQEAIVTIKNYRGNVPKDFGQLALAVHCKTNFCKAYGDKDHLLQSYLWAERVETTFLQEQIYIESDNGCKEPVREHSIVEKLYLHDGGELHIYYSNPQYVKLGRDVLRESCTDKCVNRFVKDSPYSINIKGDGVQANFKDGVIFIEYYAIPADEDGLPIIPDTMNGYLEEYLEYTVKRRLLEDALMSKDSTALANMFSLYLQMEKELFERAIVDTNPFTMKTFWDAIGKRRNDMSKFDINLGKINYGSTRQRYSSR